MSELTRPQVKFPPPLFYLFMILIGVGVDAIVPLSWAADFIFYWLGIALVGLGLATVMWTSFEFRRHQTTILPHKASSKIIRDGPFLVSRNPIYVSFTMIQIGVGIALGNVWVLLLVIPTLWIMTKFVIEKEEAFLKQAFGNDYLDYYQRVRRWI